VHIFLSYGVLFALGTGPVYTLPISIASRWFVKRRGLAVGIVISGAGIGIMLMTPLSAWLNANYGWPTSYFILAMIALFILIPSALLLKGAPREKIDLSPSSRGIVPQPVPLVKRHYGKAGDFTIGQAAKTSIFWPLLCIPFFVAICAFIVMTHIVPHAIDLGINQVQAASILSFIGGTSILGTLLMGRASDIMGRKPLIMISALLMAGAMFWLTWSSSSWMLYLFAVVFGFSYGGISSPVNAFIGDVFGTRHIGVILAVLSSPFSIGAAVGPALAGYIFDVSGSYYLAFLAGMVAALITAILALFLRVPAK